MKKFISIILMAVLGCFVLVGCTDPKDSSSTTEETTITTEVTDEVITESTTEEAIETEVPTNEETTVAE